MPNYSSRPELYAELDARDQCIRMRQDAVRKAEDARYALHLVIDQLGLRHSLDSWVTQRLYIDPETEGVRGSWQEVVLQTLHPGVLPEIGALHHA